VFSVILGTHNLNTADVSLSNKRTYKQTNKTCHGELRSHKTRRYSVLSDVWSTSSGDAQVGDVGLPQELHRSTCPTCPTSVTSLHLLECAPCVQLTPGHVYLVVHTMVTVFAVLPLPVLVCGTVCRCSFENRTFRSTVWYCVEDVFVLGDGDRGVLRLVVKSVVYEYAYLLTFL